MSAVKDGIESRPEDDGIDHELIAFLRSRMNTDSANSDQTDLDDLPADTGVLSSAGFICNKSIDVALNMDGILAAADRIWNQMQLRKYSFEAWNANPLHPSVEKDGPDFVLDFVFTVDLLNFSFWSTRPDGLDGEDGRFSIEWEGKRYTGYWSLIAALRRALSEEFSPAVVATVFRSATSEQMPLLTERFDCLREAGTVISHVFDSKVSNILFTKNSLHRSAGQVVNLLAHSFHSFRDEHLFHGRKVRIMKRAQIFVADVWAAFRGQGYGHFEDIDSITMFADYRVPQMLHSMKCLRYSPRLEHHITEGRDIPSGSVWEVEMRGCSIWCVDKIRSVIEEAHLDAKGQVNAVLIDFFLYDTVKQLEQEMLERQKATADGGNGGSDGVENEDDDEREYGDYSPNVQQVTESPILLPHHRTRSIWY